MGVSILAVSTAVPSYAFAQEDIAEKFIDMLSIEQENAKALKQLYQNSAIHTRYSVIPDFTKERHEWKFFDAEFPKKIPGMAQRNDLYKIEAPRLAFEAAAKALKSWGGDPNTITHIISVSCTGMVAPGIEFNLMKLLNLKSSTQRLGINFMGCFGAFKGLSVAEAFAKEDPKHRILLVCTELCSLHFQVDQTVDNILANSLFSDGSAAVVVGANPQSPEKSLWEIRNKGSIGLDDTLDKMGWEAGDQGFVMKLSHKVPVLLGRNIVPFIQSLVDSNFSYTNCDWAIHPGGKSIIQAIEKALELEEGLTSASWETLANYGNMSSATFLFVLHRLLEQKSVKKWTVCRRYPFEQVECFMKISKRSYENELLDLGPSYYTQEEYDDCLHQLARIRRFLGGNKATLQAFNKISNPISILDVGCGGGQFVMELAEQFPQAQVVGLDISSEAIEFANKHLREAALKNVRFDLSTSAQLPYPTNSFDVVTSTLVCHHLNDDQLIDFLKNSYQIAKKAIIINDLHRHWLAYSGFALIAKLFFPNRLIYHDGLLSIKRAFKRQDWIEYLNAAEIPLKYCSITWHWAFRWIVTIDTSAKV